ncbi:MAG: LCP family protein [Candidatus Levybacteria bacterium]|nr:LCP family protein [Candidatus Levybacteria bacterium]
MHNKKIKIIVVACILILVGGLILEASKYSSFLFQLFFNNGVNLKKQDDHINLLGLGVGGGTHDGPNLTDTIIFISLDLKTNKITMVSIPRDLWIPDLSAKINTAYAIGEGKKKGGGLLLSKAVVSKVMGQSIDYVVKIDFDGFIKAVNMVGGVDILVDKSFDDYEYPIEGKEVDTCGHKEEEIQMLATASSQLEAFPCRYERLHFEKGLNRMDGKTALEFVRSRHAKGEEGTDFARSKRQEKTITALKKKILSPQIVLSPTKLLGLYGILKSSIETDIKQDEMDDFIRLAQKIKDSKMQNAILDYGNEQEKRAGLLINPPISENFQNQWVLTPRTGNGNFSEIQKYVECEIIMGNCPITKKP